MMDVLPPKWTELFQHQEEEGIVEQEQEAHRNIDTSRGSCQWHGSSHYKTYHHACTIHSQPQHLPQSPRRYRTHSYSSNASITEPLCFLNKEGETQLCGTRFRLTKATIPMDNQEDEEEEEEQSRPRLSTDDQYV